MCNKCTPLPTLFPVDYTCLVCHTVHSDLHTRPTLCGAFMYLECSECHTRHTDPNTETCSQCGKGRFKLVHCDGKVFDPPATDPKFHPAPLAIPITLETGVSV